MRGTVCFRSSPRDDVIFHRHSYVSMLHAVPSMRYAVSCMRYALCCLQYRHRVMRLWMRRFWTKGGGYAPSKLRPVCCTLSDSRTSFFSFLICKIFYHL